MIKLSKFKLAILTGVAMLAIGFSVYGYFNEIKPTGLNTEIQEAFIVDTGLVNIGELVGGLGFWIIVACIIMYIIGKIRKKQKERKSKNP
jgi:hypothetical protein